MKYGTVRYIIGVLASDKFQMVKMSTMLGENAENVTLNYKGNTGSLPV